MPTPRPSSGPAIQPGQPPTRAGTYCEGRVAMPAVNRNTVLRTPSRPSAPSARSAPSLRCAPLAGLMLAVDGAPVWAWAVGPAACMSLLLRLGNLQALRRPASLWLQLPRQGGFRPRWRPGGRPCDAGHSRAASYATPPPQKHRAPRGRATPCADPLRRRRRGPCGRCAGVGRADLRVRRAGGGHRHRRSRRHGTPAAARGRGWLPRTAALLALDIHARLLAAQARLPDPHPRQPALVPVRLTPAGAQDRRARPRRGRLHLPGRDGGAGAAAAHRRRPVPDGGYHHRPDGPVLLGAAGNRHASGDVRRVDGLGRAHRGARERAAGTPADIRGVPAAARPARGTTGARTA